MKKIALLPILLFTLSLSSCGYVSAGYRYINETPFIIIETEDGRFKSFPNYYCSDARHFYAEMMINQEPILMYCLFVLRAPMFYLSNEMNDLVKYQIMRASPLKEGKTLLEMYFGGYKDSHIVDYDSSLAEWKQTGHIRDANDDEIDAKYFTETSFQGLDGKLELNYVDFLSGYTFGEKGLKKYYRYLKTSSVFTFKLLAKYNDEELVFAFLDDGQFAFYDKMGKEELASGTYVSSREGMTLSFEENVIFNFGLDSIELTAFNNTKYREYLYNIYSGNIYLNTYLDSEYPFWIQQYEAEHQE